MFEVYNTRTGDIVRKCKDFVKANQLVIDYTSTYMWINGDKFDFRVATDNKTNNKPLQKCAR